MKRYALIFCAALSVLGLAQNQVQASGGACYGGYQPWYNIFAHRYKCLTPEEERLQRFWHDYYNALKSYYDALDNIDWVAYYKNHGYQINCGYGPNCGPSRIHYAPVFVSPTMQWAVPNSCLSGPPGCPAPCPGPGCCGPMGGPMGGPMPPMMGGPGGPMGGPMMGGPMGGPMGN